MKRRGELRIVAAPSMFAGKTTELGRLRGVYEATGQSTMMITHSLDVRDGNEGKVYTHSGLENHVVHIDPTNISFDDTMFGTVDVLIIDEAQFFKEWLIDFVRYWYYEKDKCVVVGGLISTYADTSFGNIKDILHFGITSFVMLHAKCSICKKRDAIYTRTREQQFETVVIGKADKYFVVCRKCVF